MIRNLIIAAGLALALLSPALADPQKFTSEDSAVKFCKSGNVVCFNPDSKIYFEPSSRNYAHAKQGVYTCRALAEQGGFRANKSI